MIWNLVELHVNIYSQKISTLCRRYPGGQEWEETKFAVNKRIVPDY